jgi:hypothetical protein
LDELVPIAGLLFEQDQNGSADIAATLTTPFTAEGPSPRVAIMAYVIVSRTTAASATSRTIGAACTLIVVFVEH